MADPAVRQALQQQAVDIAFTRHVSDLFDRFVMALKLEKDHNPSRSHALDEFTKDYWFAKLAHKEVTDYIATQ